MSYWCDKHSQYKPCRACQMEALRNKQEKSDGMTPTNHLDELKKLRARVRAVGDVQDTRVSESELLAIDHFIKREESLANAEGHAALLNDASLYQCLYPAKRKQFEAALEAGALALTERATLMAEVEKLREALREIKNNAADLAACGALQRSNVRGDVDTIREVAEAALTAKEQTHE